MNSARVCSAFLALKLSMLGWVKAMVFELASYTFSRHCTIMQDPFVSSCREIPSICDLVCVWGGGVNGLMAGEAARCEWCE